MRKILIPIVVVLAVVVYQSLFVVQEVNQAIVLQFGDPKKIITKPGLNYKIPLNLFGYSNASLYDIIPP